MPSGDDTPVAITKGSARFIGRTLREFRGRGRGEAPNRKRPRVVGGGGGGGGGTAFTQRAIVTEAAGASTHIAGGIQFGTIGKCRLLGDDGGRLLGSDGQEADECEFKSVHRVQIPIGVIINLSSPDTIRPGTVWETSGETPVSRIVGEFTEVTDYLHELAGNGQMKSLAIGEGGSAATDIKWLGKTCTT